jgi:hypothetical protein
LVKTTNHNRLGRLLKIITSSANCEKKKKKKPFKILDYWPRGRIPDLGLDGERFREERQIERPGRGRGKEI